MKKRRIKKIATRKVKECFFYNLYIKALKRVYGKKVKTRLYIEISGKKKSAKKNKIWQTLTFTVRSSEDRIYRIFPNGL
ncbi:MAG: hypothetical protein ACRDD8_15820 [Bacteroidales bacterium]